MHSSYRHLICATPHSPSNKQTKQLTNQLTKSMDQIKGGQEYAFFVQAPYLRYTT